MLTMACLLTHYLLAQFTEPAMLHMVVALISLHS